MGRTNSTYRKHLDNFLKSFKPLRKALRAENRKYFDRLEEDAHSFAHAASYLNHSNPRLPGLFSMILGNRRKIEKLEKRIEDLEN
ncbi:MAG: hypothetical protein ABEJ87_03800 [Candidatus Nanohalobium sp.]